MARRLQVDPNWPQSLGYDPRPEQMDWYNTPIPRVNNPLPATPELVAIARTMWWNGDPWTILRNRYEFLHHAVDYAFDEHCVYLWETIPREDWITMLQTSRPGQISTRSWLFWRFRAGLFDLFDPVAEEWQQSLHIKDKIYDYRKTWKQLKEELRNAEQP